MSQGIFVVQDPLAHGRARTAFAGPFDCPFGQLQSTQLLPESAGVEGIQRSASTVDDGAWRGAASARRADGAEAMEMARSILKGLIWRTGTAGLKTLFWTLRKHSLHIA